MADQEESRQALRPAAGAMLVTTLAEEMARLKKSPEWQSGDRHAVSLVKNGPLNLLLIALKKGARLSEHHTRGPIALQVLAGKIEFDAAGQRVAAKVGSLLALDRDVAHSVEAVAETIALLTTAIG